MTDPANFILGGGLRGKYRKSMRRLNPAVDFDPSDLSTVFQDAAGTIPAGVGDDVGRVNCSNGSGYYLYQDDDLLKPTLMQDSAGKLYLYFFAGTFMETLSVDLTASDEVTVFCAWEKEVDTNSRVIYEFSTAADDTSNHGTFALLAPRTNLNSDGQAMASGDGFRSVLTYVGLSVGEKYVTTHKVGLSAGMHQLWVDGSLEKNVTASMGDGPMGNHVLYVGSRAGTSLVFQGAIYGLTIIQSVTGTVDTKRGEAVMAKRIGVTL
jgi:hypothetical protein